jgi:hypothetical protein
MLELPPSCLPPLRSSNFRMLIPLDTNPKAEISHHKLMLMDNTLSSFFLSSTAQNFIKLGVTSQKVSKSYKQGKRRKKSDYYTGLYNIGGQHSLLLYAGLGPAMLRQHSRSLNFRQYCRISSNMNEIYILGFN